jgi:dCTP deaminase
VREDLSLNQLRLSVGSALLSDDDVRAFHNGEPLLFDRGSPIPGEKLAFGGGLFLGLDLHGDAGGYVGHRARDNAPLLDVARSADVPVDPEPFWEPVKREDGDRVVLTPQRFYLLMSNEAVCIPPTLASEMTAYDPTSGELRTHYAGFFDPGFGFDPGGSSVGSRAALEVRAHDVPFMIEHGQRVCKLTFEHMLEAPARLYGQGIGSNYQGQHETLSKHFSH